MFRIEPPDELIELERGFPNVAQEPTSQASSDNTTAPVDSGIVPFVPGATAVELAGANFQSSVFSSLDFFDFVLYFFYFALE